MPHQYVQVKKERDFRAHGHIWHTSSCLLRAAQEIKEGQFHQFLASLVFTAFSLEAYLNWLGERMFPHWEYLQRLSPLEKLELLSDHLEVKLDRGIRPFQTITELFKFRNSVAHAKPELLQEDTVEKVGEHFDAKFGTAYIKTWWEEYCKPENAERAREDVGQIMTLLHDAAGIENDSDPFFTGFQVHGTGPA